MTWLAFVRNTNYFAPSPGQLLRKIVSRSKKHELEAMLPLFVKLFLQIWSLFSVFIIILNISISHFYFSQQHLHKIRSLEAQFQLMYVIRILPWLFYILLIFRFHTPEVEVQPLPLLKWVPDHPII